MGQKISKTIQVTPALDAFVRRYAKQHGWSEALVYREAVRRMMVAEREQAPSQKG